MPPVLASYSSKRSRSIRQREWTKHGTEMQGGDKTATILRQMPEIAGVGVWNCPHFGRNFAGWPPVDTDRPPLRARCNLRRHARAPTKTSGATSFEVPCRAPSPRKPLGSITEWILGSGPEDDETLDRCLMTTRVQRAACIASAAARSSRAPPPWTKRSRSILGKSKPALP